MVVSQTQIHMSFLNNYSDQKFFCPIKYYVCTNWASHFKLCKMGGVVWATYTCLYLKQERTRTPQALRTPIHPHIITKTSIAMETLSGYCRHRGHSAMHMDWLATSTWKKSLLHTMGGSVTASPSLAPLE